MLPSPLNEALSEPGKEAAVNGGLMAWLAFGVGASQAAACRADDGSGGLPL